MLGATGGGSRRCSVDGISFPNTAMFSNCPVCGGSTTFMQDVPDKDWDWKSTLLLQQKEKGVKPSTELGDLGILTVDVPVKKKHGYWIHYWDLYDAGARGRLAVGTLIRVGETVYEVLDYVEPLRSFAVRPFSFKLSEAEIRKLSDG